MNRSDFDLTGFLNNESHHIKSTQNSYNTYLRRFNKFLDVEDLDDGCIVRKEHLTDDNIASFFGVNATERVPTPHGFKGICAALAYACKAHGIPAFRDNTTDYPRTNIAIMIFQRKLKETPWIVKTKQGFNIDSLSGITNLKCDNDEQLLDQVIVLFSCHTSLRAEDLHGVMNNNIEVLQEDKKNPRRICCILDHQKNDKTGSGTTENRTYIIPCCCKNVLEKHSSERKLFLRNIRKDPFCPCPIACPFGIINKYLSRCPMSSTANLPFIRSLSSRGDPRTLASGSLGINYIKKAFNNVNERLPQELQISKPSGHTGRHTYVSNSINEGVDSEVVAAGSKHKSNVAIKRYFHPDHTKLAAGSMAQSKGIYNKENECSESSQDSINNVKRMKKGNSTYEFHFNCGN